MAAPIALSDHRIRLSPKTRPNYKQSYYDVLEQQSLIMRDMRDPETAPSARAQLARAWDVLEDRKRILRGKGKPKDIPANNDPERRSQKRKAVVIEPTVLKPE